MPRELTSTYDELVEKAQVLFWKKGFKGVSVKGLADYLEVSPSVIYNKYSKDILFLDSLDYYTTTYSDPFLSQLRETTEGLNSLKEFFHALIDALLDRTFPKSCLMVNTIVELRNENDDVVDRYDDYLEVLRQSYVVVLNKAYALGQFERRDKIDDYADYLLGMIFSLSILYKIRSKDELYAFVERELTLIT